LLSPVAVQDRTGPHHRRCGLPRAQRLADHPARFHALGHQVPAWAVVRRAGCYDRHRYPGAHQDPACDLRARLMATRPRTLKDARAEDSTNSELAWWLFMRISGFILVSLVFAHIFAINILSNSADFDFDYVASRLSQPAVRVLDSFL